MERRLKYGLVELCQTVAVKRQLSLKALLSIFDLSSKFYEWLYFKQILLKKKIQFYLFVFTYE